MVNESPAQVPFIDLGAQRKIIQNKINIAIENVLDHGKFINGPEVNAFENSLKSFAGVKYAVTCGSGTDALLLSLMLLEVGPGDAVFVPSFTFVATAEVVALLKATPFFVDVKNDSFNMDIESLKDALVYSKKLGLKPKAIIPVDLFGQPADYKKINDIAKEDKVYVIGDAAQSFGASMETTMVGNLCDLTATSFFPSKPLGCYGDGGAIFTNNENFAHGLYSLRSHGGGKNKYDNVKIGLNSRLDTIQAAILNEKIKLLENEIILRNSIAEKYDSLNDYKISTPNIYPGFFSAWAQYTIKLEKRETVSNSLKLKGIPTNVYYPTPLHRQKAFISFPCSPNGLKESESLSDRVLSLPMYPYLDSQKQDYIMECLINEIKN